MRQAAIITAIIGLAAGLFVVQWLHREVEPAPLQASGGSSDEPVGEAPALRIVSLDDASQRLRPASGESAKRIAYAGDLRVGTEKDYSAFLGDGSLTIEASNDALERIDAPVVDGRFAFELDGVTQVTAVGGLLSGLPIRLGAPTVLTADHEQPVYFTWGDRRVHVAVLDRDSGEHLRNVEVLREADVRFGFQDPVFTQNRWLVPRDTDETVLAGASSPLVLDIPEGGSDRFWITSPGYVPYRYRFPAGLPRTKLVVALRRSGGVAVDIVGDTSVLDECVLRIYKIGGEHMPWLPPPIAEQPARPVQRIDGLAPGSYGATLERPAGPAGTDLVLARSEFALEAEGETHVLLIAQSPTAIRTAHIVIGLPDLGPDERGLKTARLESHGLEASAGDRTIETLWAVATEWGPLELRPGDYSLVLLPDNVSMHFSVASGETRRLQVPRYEMVDCFLTILDRTSGEPVAPQLAYWSTALDWSGSADDWPLSHRIALSVDEFPIPLRTPRSLVHVLVGAEGYGHQLRVLDLSADLDPVILLDRLSCLDIELQGMDDIPTTPWLWETELTLNGAAVEPESTLVVTQDGIPRGRVYFAGSGSVVMRFPPLPSHGSVLPLEVAIEPGEFRRITVGPEHLLAVE